MGQSESKRREELEIAAEYVFKKLREENIIPDVGVVKILLDYSGINSIENLKLHYQRRELELGDCAADWAKNLVDRLGEFTSFPAAGLGALVVSIVIDVAMAQFKLSQDNNEDSLRKVFAEQKSSAVRDYIEEYLNRHQRHLHNEIELKKDIEWVERNLSFALTQLKNSMLDGHIDSGALRTWINGSLFHAQVLIQQARLTGGTDDIPARNALKTYEENLKDLSKKYKRFKVGTFSYYIDRDHHGFLEGHAIVDNESGKSIYIPESAHPPFSRICIDEEFVDAMYSSYFEEILSCFEKTRANLGQLIAQGEAFQLPTHTR